MSGFGATKARRVLAALMHKGWRVKRQSGSHRTRSHPDHSDVVFAFHDADEIGPRMLTRLARQTGREPDDL